MEGFGILSRILRSSSREEVLEFVVEESGLQSTLLSEEGRNGAVPGRNLGHIPVRNRDLDRVRGPVQTESVGGIAIDRRLQAPNRTLILLLLQNHILALRLQFEIHRDLVALKTLKTLIFYH